MREVAELLLECGADINTRDRVGKTALFSAVGDPKMNKRSFVWCLENGADPGAVDADGLVVFDKGGRTDGGNALCRLIHLAEDSGWV